MITVKKYSCPNKDGFYNQKLILEDGKIKDMECNCKWGQVHQHAWKKEERICKHLEQAMITADIERRRDAKKDR